MLTFQRLATRNFKQLRSFTHSSSVLSSKKDNVDEKDDSKPSKKKTSGREEKTPTKEETSTKLNDLLKLMIESEESQPKKEVQLAQAVKQKREKPKKKKPLGEKLADAAKDVAKSIGGDLQKTESELLNILLRSSESRTLTDVLKGIKVEKEVQPEAESRAQYVRSSLGRIPADPSQLPATDALRQETRRQKKKTAPLVDILGATPSSYFKDLQPQPASCELQTWQRCVDRDLRLAVTHPPQNIYEQMIQWTDRGMFWQFPIDNEQGLDEEKQVSFEDHIFLETHLEGWCPETGPVRFFMELVCVGLSKNYWLTVEEKKEHIFWFRDYFIEKKEVLKEIGAGTIAMELEEKRDLFVSREVKFPVQY